MRSSTITLYIDTSSSYLYSGIVIGDELKVSCNEYLGKNLSTYALSKIANMFDQINILPEDVDQIMVVHGPGSFTGIRIGVTIAKTYAWAMKKDVIVINSLEAMAVSFSEDFYKVPFIDARRGYVFGGIYDASNQVVLKNQYIRLETLVEAANSLMLPYKLITNDSVSLDHVSYIPDILKIVTTFRNRSPIHPHAVCPEYLKHTEAEENQGIVVE